MSQRKVKLQFNDEVEVEKYREQVGLRKIRTGFIKCLRCAKEFFSIDRCNNRLCSNCKDHEE